MKTANLDKSASTPTVLFLCVDFLKSGGINTQKRVCRGTSEGNGIFIPALALSFILHLLVLSVWHAFSRPVQYSVKEAPASMEIVLVKAASADGGDAPLNNIPIYEKPLFDDVDWRESSDKISMSARVEHAAVSPGAAFKPKANVYQGALTQARPLDNANPAPIYPHTARRHGWEGTVFLKVFVEESGDPREVNVERGSGYRVLDQAALDTIREWRFSPAQKGSLNVASWITVPVQFALVNEQENPGTTR